MPHTRSESFQHPENLRGLHIDNSQIVFANTGPVQLLKRRDAGDLGAASI